MPHIGDRIKCCTQSICPSVCPSRTSDFLANRKAVETSTDNLVETALEMSK